MKLLNCASVLTAVAVLSVPPIIAVEAAETAKAMLKEAGYDEHHPIEFEVLTNNDAPIFADTATLLKSQMEKIGIKINIVVLDTINTAFADQAYARRHLIDFLEKSVRRNEMTALLVLSQTKTQTIPVGLSSLQGGSAIQFAEIMASSVLGILPLLAVFLLFQRAIVQGVASTGIK